MNIACSSCPAKYAVPDEKVRGRKVRITCKRCGAAIIVDGTAAVHGTEPGTPTSERKRQATIVGGLAAPSNSAPGAPVAQPASPGARPAGVVVAKTAGSPGAAARLGGAGPRPAAAAPAPAPEPAWTVALTEDDHREMNTPQVVEAYAAGTIDTDTFIWRDGMEDWLTPFEIPAIAAALRAKGLGPDAPPARAEEPARPQQQSGWREPGRWDDGHPPKAGDVTFDDVTVAMEAPKAQALIDAAGTSPSGTPAAEPDPGKDEPTVVGDASRFLGDEPADEPTEAPPPAEPPKARPGPRPAAGVPPPAPSADVTAPATKMAARAAAARRSSPDLFAERNEDEVAARSKMPTIPPEPAGAHGSMTGARNESSVLFSLDQLAGKPQPGTAKKPAVDKVDEAELLMGAPTPSKASFVDDDAPPSVARIGDGTLFGGAATTMAAPDFTAPAAPSAPSNPPVPVSTAPAQPADKGSTPPLWLAVAAVAIVGGIIAFFILKPAPPPVVPEPAPTATPAPPPTAAPAATEPAAPPAAIPATAAAPPAAPAPVATAPGIPATALTAAAAPPTAAAPVPAPQPGAPAPAQQPGALLPKPAPKPAEPAAAPAAAEGPPFDREAAAAALATAAATAQGECASQEGTHGNGKVTVTFVNSGRATNALVSGDFAGSALGGCVARVFRSARIPAFSGDSVRVTKGVRIP